MNKRIKTIVEQLEMMIGEEATGHILAGILDSFNEMVDGKDEFELRSFKLVFNDYYEKELLK